MAARAEHVREVLTGYRSGHSELAQPGEPRPEFDLQLPMEARYAAKSAELAVTDRTIKRRVRSYRQLGVAGPGRIPPVLPAAWLEPLRAPALAASAPTPAKGTIG